MPLSELPIPVASCGASIGPQACSRAAEELNAPEADFSFCLTQSTFGETISPEAVSGQRASDLPAHTTVVVERTGGRTLLLEQQQKIKALYASLEELQEDLAAEERATANGFKQWKRARTKQAASMRKLQHDDAKRDATIATLINQNGELQQDNKALHEKFAALDLAHTGFQESLAGLLRLSDTLVLRALVDDARIKANGGLDLTSEDTSLIDNQLAVPGISKELLQLTQYSTAEVQDGNMAAHVFTREEVAEAVLRVPETDSYQRLFEFVYGMKAEAVKSSADQQRVAEVVEQRGAEAAEQRGAEAAEQSGAKVAEQRRAEVAEQRGAGAAEQPGAEAAELGGAEVADKHAAEAVKQRGAEAAEQHGAY